MLMNDILSIILNYFKHYTIDFDVYVIADTQERTKYLYPSEYPHADESEFFSREEFAEIASAIFYVFGYVRVFYSEMEFIEYFIQNKLCPKQFVVYNFARDGQANGKKSLIPAFCDLMNIHYTGSNAFVISLLRNKDIYTMLLGLNKISVPKSMVYKVHENPNHIITELINEKVIVKNIHESASIGLSTQNVFEISEDASQELENICAQMHCNELLIQEFIDGPEFEVLVIQFRGVYYSLMPVEIVFPDSHTYIDSEISNAYQYQFKIANTEIAPALCKAAEKAATIMRIKDYARFDFRMKNGVPYLFDIAGTPYTIHHSSIAYLFTQYYHLPYESIYKVVVACMLSNYDLDT